MNIIEYVPRRDTMGRFKPSKKKVFKFLFVVAALASFYGNYFLAKQIWNVKCAESGYFTTKAKCHELAEIRMDAQRAYAAEMERVNNNNNALIELGWE